MARGAPRSPAWSDANIAAVAKAASLHFFKHAGPGKPAATRAAESLMRALLTYCVTRGGGGVRWPFAPKPLPIAAISPWRSNSRDPTLPPQPAIVWEVRKQPHWTAISFGEAGRYDEDTFVQFADVAEATHNLYLLEALNW